MRSAAAQLLPRAHAPNTVAERRSCFRTHPIFHHKSETAETLRGFKHMTVEAAQRTRLQTFLQIVRRVNLQDITLVHISLRACSLNDEMFKSLVNAAGVVPSCSFLHISCNDFLPFFSRIGFTMDNLYGSAFMFGANQKKTIIRMHNSNPAGDGAGICKLLDVSLNRLTTLMPLCADGNLFKNLAHLCADGNLFKNLKVW